MQHKYQTPDPVHKGINFIEKQQITVPRKDPRMYRLERCDPRLWDPLESRSWRALCCQVPGLPSFHLSKRVSGRLMEGIHTVHHHLILKQRLSNLLFLGLIEIYIQLMNENIALIFQLNIQCYSVQGQLTLQFNSLNACTMHPKWCCKLNRRCHFKLCFENI